MQLIRRAQRAKYCLSVETATRRCVVGDLVVLRLLRLGLDTPSCFLLLNLPCVCQDVIAPDGYGVLHPFL